MLGPIANGLAEVISIVLNMLQLVVIASVIISWVGADPNNPIVRMIESITEPIFRPIRRWTRNIPGPFDWAPLIVILILIFIQRGLVPYIYMLG